MHAPAEPQAESVAAICHWVAGSGGPLEGRVKSVTAGRCTTALTRCGSREEVDDAIATAIAHDGPALVEVIADPELI